MQKKQNLIITLKEFFMKKNIIKVALVAVVGLIAGINVFNAQKSDTLSDIALANVEALANTEQTACPNPSHCVMMDNQTCWYYIITGDNNKLPFPLANHIHEGIY